jgi:hypothetical protein
MFFAPHYTTTTPRRRNRLHVWCCCVALGLGLGLWESRADGSCGDYLAVSSGHFAMPGAKEMEHLANPTHGGSPVPGDPARSPCECSGCSSHEAPVTTAPVVERTQRDLTWACAAPVDEVLKSLPRWATPPQESLAAQDFFCRLLRPPKSLSRE